VLQRVWVWVWVRVLTVGLRPSGCGQGWGTQKRGFQGVWGVGVGVGVSVGVGVGVSVGVGVGVSVGVGVGVSVGVNTHGGVEAVRLVLGEGEDVRGGVESAPLGIQRSDDASEQQHRQLHALRPGACTLLRAADAIADVSTTTADVTAGVTAGARFGLLALIFPLPPATLCMTSPRAASRRRSASAERDRESSCTGGQEEERKGERRKSLMTSEAGVVAPLLEASSWDPARRPQAQCICCLWSTAPLSSGLEPGNVACSPLESP